MWQKSISLLVSVIMSLVIGSSRGIVAQGSCSSSCGDIQNIRHPFRLRGDPTFCGNENFELVCSGNKTILRLPSGDYYVTQISYDNNTIHVVDVRMASGSCSLPFHLPTSSVTYYNYLRLQTWRWASFVNCSKSIQDDTYRHVPCLSKNDTSVYVTSGGFVEDLCPSCGFLSMVPTSVDNIASSGDTLFQNLQRGFSLEWVYKNLTSFQMIHTCLKEASREVNHEMQGKSMYNWMIYPFLVEHKVMECVNSYKETNYKHSHAAFKMALLFMVLFDIALFLFVFAMLGRFILAPLSIIVFLAYKFRKLQAHTDMVENFLRKQKTLAPTRYAYSEIIAITRHFKEKLGQGGFGSVFKGELPGAYLVAVKMLGNSKCNGEEFISEVSTIGRIHHHNVVQLIGFCSDGTKRALIFEFMPNGSLDKYIFSSRGTKRHFTLQKLNEIALGVAKGIEYLHQGCDMRILHFDIKPHNILLDQNYNPKVSDFGLAKLYPKDYSLVSMSAARGTIGYIAPELISRSFGAISHKSDVYSFGMLLMEMAGGRRNVDPRLDASSQFYYPSWIYDQLTQSEGLEVCNGFEIDDVERKLCKVGLWCIQVRPSDRPSMSQVVEMLEADADTLQLPPKPFMSSPNHMSIRQSRMESSLEDLSIVSENEQSSVAQSSASILSFHVSADLLSKRLDEESLCLLEPEDLA